MSQEEDRRVVLSWVALEMEHYSNQKFDDQRDGHDADIKAHGFNQDPEAFWMRQVAQYWDRVRLYNLLGDEGTECQLKAKQALLKSLVTLVDACACMYRAIDGPMPEPGHNSSEGIPPVWERP